MKRRIIALALLIPAFLQLIDPCPFANSAIVATKISKTAGNGIWKFSLQTIGSTGRTTRKPLEPDITLKASGHWVYAQVRITNISATRQSAKNLIITTSSTLVNAKGKSYELNDAATGDIYDLLENNFFSPGESRDIYFFFDTPTNETFQWLEIIVMKSLANIRLSFK